MRCLVTAGPTIEPLDEVRRLTNFSTGRLGTELANALAAAGHETTLLLGRQATWRGASAAVAVELFSSTRDLDERLAAHAGDSIDAVFHASAVSDFAFGRVWEETPEGARRQLTGGKLSSRSGRLIAELLPTPKLIATLRDRFPRARIFGWKYEVDGDREAALARARGQIADNRTDYCVANGPAYGEGFGLVNQAGGVTHFADREGLLAGLIEALKASGS